MHFVEFVGTVVILSLCIFGLGAVFYAVVREAVKSALRGMVFKRVNEDGTDYVERTQGMKAPIEPTVPPKRKRGCPRKNPNN